MKKELQKEAESSGTQSVYIDESGNVFSAQDIVGKSFKPSGKYKLYSLSDRVQSSDFGKNNAG